MTKLMILLALAIMIVGGVIGASASDVPNPPPSPPMQGTVPTGDACHTDAMGVVHCAFQAH